MTIDDIAQITRAGKVLIEIDHLSLVNLDLMFLIVWLYDTTITCPYAVAPISNYVAALC